MNYYFGTRKLINNRRLGGKKVLFDLFHLFRILSWRAWQAQMAAKCCDITWFRHRGRSTASSFDSRLRFLPGQRLRLQQLLKHSFSKCSEQMWHWLSLGKFVLLIRTSHSLRSGLFFKGSRWKLLSL